MLIRHPSCSQDGCHQLFAHMGIPLPEHQRAFLAHYRRQPAAPDCDVLLHVFGLLHHDACVDVLSGSLAVISGTVPTATAGRPRR